MKVKKIGYYRYYYKINLKYLVKLINYQNIIDKQQKSFLLCFLSQNGSKNYKF